MTETLCVCGHAAEPHQHHRDRRDCSRCGRELCREFRPLTWWRRVLQRCEWYPAPLPDPVPAVDLTSLFTPARFQVVPLDADGNRIEADWEQIEATVRGNAVRMAGDPELTRDADGRPIEVGDWVEILDSSCQIGEVVEAPGQWWCEVRVPPGDVPRAEYGARLRVIVEEES